MKADINRHIQEPEKANEAVILMWRDRAITINDGQEVKVLIPRCYVADRPVTNLFACHEGPQDITVHFVKHRSWENRFSGVQYANGLTPFTSFVFQAGDGE